MNRDTSLQESQLLSEYLDGRLSSRDRIQIEARLQAQPELRDELEQLRRTRLMLKQLPKRRVPRNFFVTPEMVHQKAQRQLFPVFRFASALAGLFLVVVFASDLLFGAAPQNAAPAMAPLSMQSESSQTNRAANANSPIIIWGTPTPGGQSFSGGLGMGMGADTASQASGLAATPPTVSANAIPDFAATPEFTPGYGGGAPATSSLAPETATAPAVKAAAPHTGQTPTEQTGSSSTQTTSSVQDAYQSGPILGVNPTEGAAEASALMNPPQAPFSLPRTDFHIFEGALAVIAVLAGLAAVYFHRRESL